MHRASCAAWARCHPCALVSCLIYHETILIERWSFNFKDPCLLPHMMEVTRHGNGEIEVDVADRAVTSGGSMKPRDANLRQWC